MKNIYFFDLEGTISNHNHRIHLLPKKESEKTPTKYDKFYAEFPKDKPIHHIKNLINSLFENNEHVHILIEMMQKHNRMARMWLKENYVKYDTLIMRGDRDFRPSPEYKLEMLKDHAEFETTSTTFVVFDDRDDVIKALHGAVLTNKVSVIAYKV